MHRINKKEYTFFNGKAEFLSLSTVLEKCENTGHSPVFLPELAEVLITNPEIMSWDIRPLSIRITGRTSRGTAVQVYAHIPGEWTDPQYIAVERKDKSSSGTLGGSLVLSQKCLDALINREGESIQGRRLVTVLDHKEIVSKTRNGIVSPNKALEDPRVIASFGSEKLAERYFKTYNANIPPSCLPYYNREGETENVFIGFESCSELIESEQVLGRTLYLSDSGISTHYFFIHRKILGVRSTN
ncbi:MAG: hypothetical protein Q8R18_04005 [bacterium]|nr:hypothetical protein [bacterium]